MKIIRCLYDLINEELEDANKYASLALEYNETEKEASKLFYDLSQEELKHAQKLHDVVVLLITAYKQKNGDPPEAMLAVYNYLHEKEISKMKEIKMLIELYK